MNNIFPNETYAENYKTFILHLDREHLLNGTTDLNGFLDSAPAVDTTIGDKYSGQMLDSDGGDITQPIPSYAMTTLSYDVITASPAEVTEGTVFDTDQVAQLDGYSTVTPSLTVSNVAYVGALQLGNMLLPPVSIQGSPGDQVGMVRGDGSGNKLWYCHTDYDPLNPSNNIWKYADLIEAPPAVTGMNLRSMPVNYPFGTAGDKQGDTIVMATNTDTVYDFSPNSTSFATPFGTLFYCYADYTTGTTPIWLQISHLNTEYGGLRRDREYTTVSGNTISSFREYIAQGMITVMVSATNSTFDLNNHSKTMVYRGASANQNVGITPVGYGVGGRPFDTGNGFYFNVYNNNATYTVTFTPNVSGAGTINGASSYTLYPGQFATIMSNTYDNTYVVVEGRPPSYYFPITFSGTITPDCKYTTKFKISAMTSNLTLNNPTNMGDAETLYIRLLQDGSGSTRTITYGSKYKWPGGTAVQPSIGANKVDLITAVYDRELDILMCTMNKDFR